MNRSTVALITALPGIKFAGLRAEAAPTRFKLFNWGENRSTKGKFLVNDTTLAALPVNQKAHGLETVALDYEHNTFPGSPEFQRTQEPRPIAAMGAIEVVRGEGVFLNAIAWRKGGLEQRENYEDLSPVPGTNAAGEVVMIHSVALCRNGAVFDLTIDNATALSALLPNNQPLKDKNMLTLVALAALLGLPETATEQDVKNKFTALAAGAAPKLTTLNVTINGKAETLTPEQLAQRVIDLDAKFTALTNAVTQKERDALVSRFAAEGRMPLKADGVAYTQDELKALDTVLLTALVANTPVTVPLNQRKQGKEAPSGDVTSLFMLKAEEFGKAKNITDPADAQAQFAGTPEGAKLYAEYLTTLAPRR